jgi:hypothetical protein
MLIIPAAGSGAAVGVILTAAHPHGIDFIKIKKLSPNN